MNWTAHPSRIVAVLAGVVVAIGLGQSEAATQSSPSTSSTSVPSGKCPAHALRLPGLGVAFAAEEARHEVAQDYPGLDTRRARVMAADRSAFAGARGAEVRKQCGAKVARRTVVVQMLFPRMLPSASLSQGVVFVGRFSDGYRVWEVAH